MAHSTVIAPRQALAVAVVASDRSRPHEDVDHLGIPAAAHRAAERHERVDELGGVVLTHLLEQHDLAPVVLRGIVVRERRERLLAGAVDTR